MEGAQHGGKGSQEKRTRFNLPNAKNCRRHGKQEFHGKDTISQLPSGAVQLLICKGVMRKGENRLKKKTFFFKV